MRHLQSCSITVSQSSQYSRNFKRIKKPTPVDGLVRPSGWNQWQRFQMAEKSFYGPWPWRFVFCWRHLSPPPQTSVCCCQSGGLMHGTLLWVASHSWNQTETLALWKIHYQTLLLLLLDYALNSPSRYTLFLLLWHSKMSSYEFKCKSVGASLDSGCVFVGIWHSASGWLWFSALYFCFCIVWTFNFISRKAPQGWIKVVLSLDWVITASNMWKDKCIQH